MEHLIEPHLLNGRVKVHLVGAGGNGAQMAACLARLDVAMRALGHPHGLHVTAFDPDRVRSRRGRKRQWEGTRTGDHRTAAAHGRVLPLPRVAIAA